MSIEERIARTLVSARQAVESGRRLDDTGFWRAVSRVRGNRELALRFGREIAEIDRKAFEQLVKLRVPQAAGNGILIFGTLIGVALTVYSFTLSELPGDLVFLVGLGAVLLSSHSLTHWLFGRAIGVKFTHYFLGGPPPPRPGIKIDYESYLQVHPHRRAAFHASGALITKVVPFLYVALGVLTGRSFWVTALLLGFGMLQIVTDVLFSTKSSDWKKYRREKRAAARAQGWT